MVTEVAQEPLLGCVYSVGTLKCTLVGFPGQEIEKISVKPHDVTQKSSGRS